MTFDVTGGFGQELYFNPGAPAGTYNVQVKFFGDDNNRTSARTKVFVTLYRNFGEEGQQVVSKVVPLARKEEKRQVATLTVE